jgi:signal transduction histidine kinase
MTGWKLILALPYDSVMSHAVRSIKFIVFLDVLLMTLLIVVLSYLSNAIVITPLEDIMNVIRRLKKGDNRARIHVNRNDEFGVLSREFNHLIEKVSEYSRSLEVKVKERTSRLESLQKENVRLRVIEEKERIYGYLHDSLGARLTNIFISNSVAKTAAGKDPEVLKDMLDRIESNTEQGIADLKEILHSSESESRRIADFNKLVQCNIRERLELRNISFSYTMSTPAELNALGRDMRFELEKILQELVSNVLKHSKASSVNLVLEVRQGKIVLVISDDGHGGAEKAMERCGFGLRNIQNRVVHHGGSFHVHSPEGRGTRIKIHIPLPESGGAQ